MNSAALPPITKQPSAHHFLKIEPRYLAISAQAVAVGYVLQYGASSKHSGP